MTFAAELISQLKPQFEAAADQADAVGMLAYMKEIAPFYGIRAPARRQIVKPIFKSLPEPTSKELARAARALWKLSEREYQYAACDMLAFFGKKLDADFLAEHGQYLISHKSWWESVDSLGTAAVSPLTVRYPSVTLMNAWNKSDNIWLNRAAIQHQRGRREATDLDLLFRYCDYHSSSQIFWITKAIGWALRDVANFNRPAVTQFLKTHPELDRVAVREANKHLTK
jgi:3-methyladenine DNA glycosylase AlkD